MLKLKEKVWKWRLDKTYYNKIIVHQNYISILFKWFYMCCWCNDLLILYLITSGSLFTCFRIIFRIMYPIFSWNLVRAHFCYLNHLILNLSIKSTLSLKYLQILSLCNKYFNVIKILLFALLLLVLLMKYTMLLSFINLTLIYRNSYWFLWQFLYHFI